MPQTQSRPNIIWISLESVRADHTSVGGYHRDTTPNLRRIADMRDGRTFDNCFSHARWTPAVSTSILTGTYLTTHGVGHANTRDVRRLPDDMSTVPELLAEEGYSTAGFSTNPWISDVTGLDRGFQRFKASPNKDDFLSPRGVRAGFKYLRELTTFGAGFETEPIYHGQCLPPYYQYQVLEDWVDDLSADEEKPYFLYTHMNSSHHPYNPPLSLLEEFLGEFEGTPKEAIEVAKNLTNNIWENVAEGCDFTDQERAALMAVYDAEIAFSDHLVGKLFDYVRENTDGKTVFVVTGDHGELFGEQGVLGHNLTLHDGLTQVPMVTHGVNFSESATENIVQHIDVMQTLVGAVGGDTSQFQGYDLTRDVREYALMQRGPRMDDLDTVLEFNPDCDIGQYHAGAIDCIRSLEWKYMRSDDRTDLFDLPDEETNVADDYPEVAAEMDAKLDEMLPTKRFDDDDREAANQVELSSQMEDHLADLGYL
ncbi:sulfatase [Halogeometricum limi]|uniref:Arylsulfatase A n=1 Tax=Halogeometricum limi TaxID=555875 RepID=A0A1I6G2W1_9EURY|nr:sulfatase [Halogeometricum limi]SFR36519.1 Arylsulfatase A [Halogeometricum limi]